MLNSSFAAVRNSSNGSPFMHSHLKVEKLPGRTDKYPNKLSDPLL